ncbi:MAG: hypothetical protein Q8N28_00675 [bacterium]|nr:hypothetical protein [bacterium]
MENKRENFGNKSENKNEAEKIPEKASDMEIALFFAKHIDNPCEVEVAPDKKENIREFYLREARNALSKMTNENAKRFLELKIKEYK